MRKTHAIALAAALALGTLGSATTPAAAVPGCEANAICLWTGENGGGDLYVWKGGYVDVPAAFHDHVYSFRANRPGCFINYAEGTKEVRPVNPGDYADHYDEGFGAVLDAVGDAPC
ncbi:peptidase inhibitor family I36 protein [Streptomyces sp. GC420]|uniref:peptidase inhibitor family I36 protein n=1 Tax=Streptomyces sp. GC420 TaxID=2697568 RepID=UPI001414DA40|nr:peptidase inhibitor family I36 protein [Streptomyces sp. GC420]NBM19414.1 hypothetical protein [Streptomyces sp. GC420]